MDNKTKLAYLLIVLIACFSIIYDKLFQNTTEEHKCKAAEPKSAEPSSSGHLPDTEIPLPPSPSVLHMFASAAVVSDSEVCSQIGRDTLYSGNAVDAALATMICNGLVTMQSMGLGGGFIMNIFKRVRNKSFTVIARETAPAALKMEDFCNKGLDSNLQGPMSIAVPCEVRGYGLAHRLYGSKPWHELVEPTIKICEKGFQLSKHQWDSLFFNPRVMDDPHLRKMFVNESTGGFKSVGSIVHPPSQLCETYRTLAYKGPVDFYKGDLAKLIAEDLKDIGSIITLEDLKNSKAKNIDSIEVRMGDDVLHLVPPIGSGAVVGMVMKILRGYAFYDELLHLVPFTQRVVEALKFGFAKRWELGDIGASDLKKILRNMTSSKWTSKLSERIRDMATYSHPEHYGGKFAPVNDHGTGHISVLDAIGNAVSVTGSVHYYFGSAYMGKRTGILFNSAMGDFSIPCLPNYFSLPPSEANLARPNKRPMSSMSPTIVTNFLGHVKLVVGGAGGPKIISGLVNILIRVLWVGQDIKQAIDAPRFHHQLVPNVFEYEYGITKDIIDRMEIIGHKPLRYRERGSIFSGIMANDTAIYANVDYRKLGGVAGL